jgi:hypothetical protein
MTQLLSSTNPRARKVHRCEHCSSDIPKGTVYLKQFCVDGGDAWGFKSHKDCHELACALASQDGWDTYDGVPTLSDYEADTGVFPDHFRGKFPHAICRLELRKQLRVASA